MQFIGIEIAPAGTKAVVLDLDSAEILAEASISHSWIDGLPPGYREQEPTRWIEATDRVIRDCLNQPKVDKKQIAAIGVAGPQRGLVILDQQNRVIRPTKLLRIQQILSIDLHTITPQMHQSLLHIFSIALKSIPLTR